MKKILLIFLFVKLAFPVADVTAQSDIVHYIPPFYAAGPVGNHWLVLSTTEVSPIDVKISRGNTYHRTVTISNATPLRLNLGIGYDSETVFTGIIGADKLNKILSVEGFKLEAPKPFYCAIHHKTTSKNNGDILTCKGQSALGREFFTGHLVEGGATLENGGMFVTIMAALDNTTVTFSNPRIKYSGQSSNTFSITLNKNESYAIGSSHEIAAAAGYDFNDFNGTKITSDKPVAVNTGSWFGTTEGSGKRDIGFDQIVPLPFMGKSYVAVAGEGSVITEKVIAISTSDSPNKLIINGALVHTFNNEGEYYIIEDKYTANDNMSIKSDEKIYVYQTLAGDVKKSETIGLCFLPPTSELSSNRDIIISYAKTLATKPMINIITKTGSKVTINGIALTKSPSSVVDNNDWVTYRLTSTELKTYDPLLTEFQISADKAVNASLSVTSNQLGGAGFFSGFVNPIDVFAQDLTISLNRDDVAIVSPDSINNGSSVLFGIIDSFTIDNSIFGCDDIGSHLVTLTAWSNARFATATATITVNNDSNYCNEPPVTPDYYYETYNTPMIMDDLLKGVDDLEGNMLIVDLVPPTVPKYGTVVIDTIGTFTYIPDSTIINLADTFSYVVCDSRGECSMGWVYISADSIARIILDPISTNCIDVSSINIAYEDSLNSPDKYSIRYDDEAKAKGFIDAVRKDIVKEGEIILDVVTRPHPSIYNAMLLLEESVVYTYVMPLTFPLLYPDTLLVQKWNNVIAIKKSAYTFDAYQWLKDGEVIKGATSSSLYLGANAELDTMTEYSVLLSTDQDSTLVGSCPMTMVNRGDSVNIGYPTEAPTIAPTSLKSGQMMTVTISSNLGYVRVFDLQGNLHLTREIYQESQQLQCPTKKGFYIVEVHDDKDNMSINKIIVH